MEDEKSTENRSNREITEETANEDAQSALVESITASPDEKPDPQEKATPDDSLGACGGIPLVPTVPRVPSVPNFNTKPLRLLMDSYHCEASDEPTTESELCTEESAEKMTSSTEGMVSLSEDSSGRDTYAQAATAVYSWPLPAHSDTIELDDSDDQMNGLMGSYREISMDEEDDGTRDEDMHADTEEEVSNLSNDSNEDVDEDVDVTESDDNRRPNTLNLLKPPPSLTSSDCTRSLSSLSSAVAEDIITARTKEGTTAGSAAALSDLRGTVTKDGDMVMFVADDLQEKIKMVSPMSKKDTPQYSGSQSSTPSLYKQALTPQLPPIDPAVLTDLETHAHKIAANLDNMLENLAGTLNSMSSLTVDCMETYRDCVCKTCDVTDISIKSMYQLMAKCEELGNTMRPMYRLGDQIKEIKRLLDLFESVVSS